MVLSPVAMTAPVPNSSTYSKVKWLSTAGLTYGKDGVRPEQQAAAEHKTWRTERLKGHHLSRPGRKHMSWGGRDITQLLWSEQHSQGLWFTNARLPRATHPLADTGTSHRTPRPIRSVNSWGGARGRGSYVRRGYCVMTLPPKRCSSTPPPKRGTSIVRAFDRSTSDKKSTNTPPPPRKERNKFKIKTSEKRY